MKTFLKAIGLLFFGFIALIVIVAIAAPKSSSTPTAAPAVAQAAEQPKPEPAAAAAKPTEAPKPAPAAAPEPPKPTAIPEPPKPTGPPVIDVKTPVINGNWELQVTNVQTAAELGKTPYTAGKKAQGKFVIVTVEAKNLHKETSNLSDSDFSMQSADGIKFKSSSDGRSGIMFSDQKDPQVLWLTEQVQPGLKKSFRLVYDVDPDKTGYQLAFDKTRFALHV